MHPNLPKSYSPKLFHIASGLFLAGFLLLLSSAIWQQQPKKNLVFAGTKNPVKFTRNPANFNNNKLVSLITRGISLKPVAAIKKAVPPAAPLDMNGIRKSDWFGNVKKDIEKRFYYINSGKQPGVYSGANITQGLQAGFTSRSFSLSPLSKPDDWQLTLQLNGLYADGKRTEAAEGMAVIRQNNNDIEYGYGDRFAIQYHNDPDGVRQNFIVKSAPASNTRHLSVSLQVQGDWVISKADDRELQFARRNAHGRLDRKIIYKDLKAWDANGAPLMARMESGRNGQFSIEVNAENAAYPVTIDPLSTTANNTYKGASAYTFLGISAASAGDVNGDGYSDVIIGASGVDLNISGALSIPTTSGLAFIYLGSATGLSSTAAVTLTDGIAGDKYGVSVASAGDINGDGFSDVIVGADLYTGTNAQQGIAYVYFGGNLPTGVNPVPTALMGAIQNQIYFGYSVAGAGDVNGDGFGDVIVGNFGLSAGVGQQAYIFNGSASGISTTATVLTSPTSVSADQYGFSVAGAGDINGDGFADIIIGAPGTGSGTGAAYVYLGGSSGVSGGASFSYGGGSTVDQFGTSVAGAGDVNGDGYGDFIIGASGVEIAAVAVGSAYLYRGGPGAPAAPITVTTNIPTSDKFGCSVASAGDLNGDGFADVIVGAYGVGSDIGYAYVFWGTAAGIINTDSTVLTNNASDYFGYSVASAGDVNGDGYSDLIVGGPYAPNGALDSAGAVYVFQGGPQGSALTAASTLAVAGSGNLGFSVNSAGDLNADGYNDVVVGAYTTSSTTGATYVYLGAAAGLPATPSITLTGSGAFNAFGISTAAAGDVNGDGFGDLIVGAAAPLSTGFADIYYGNSSGVNTTPSVVLSGTAANGLFGLTVAGVGDVNGDGYKDIVVGAPAAGNGTAYYFAGSSTGISTTPTAIITGSAGGAQFGVVAGAGDVNGDGYNDFMVGEPGTSTLYVFQGSATGPVSGTAVATRSYTISAPSGSVNFTGIATTTGGASLSTAGDVNGDGFDDIIVGASGTSSNLGTAYIFTGSATGLSTSPSVTLTGAGTPGGAFGTRVTGLGDINGDGYSDVAVGAPGAGTGSVFIYSGAPGGITNTISATLNGVTSGDKFGSAVAGAGDVNGDGFSDLLAGAQSVSGGGAAYLFKGNNALGHGGNNILRLYETDLSTPIKQDNVAQTQFGLGLFVKPPYAHTKARLVWEVEGNGVPFKSGAGSTITTSVFSSGQGTYTTIPTTPVNGIELKTLITKVPTALATKVRVRVEYAPTTFSAAQTYGPWIYTQALSTGASNGVVLPLTWLSFTATVEGGQDVLLNWKTENEMNTRSFVVEHGINGVDYTDIGTVAAQGSDVGTTSYSYTHSHPGAGTHYYRLRQVDIDGNFTYSKVVTAVISLSGPAFSVYPNPATDHLTVTYTNSSLNLDVLRFVNVSGNIVKEVVIYPNGSNTNVPLTGLSKGVYFVQLASGSMPPKQVVIQ